MSIVIVIFHIFGNNFDPFHQHYTRQQNTKTMFTSKPSERIRFDSLCRLQVVIVFITVNDYTQPLFNKSW